MSRGPGRLQRAILYVLSHEQPEPVRRRRHIPHAEDRVLTDEWTTEDVCSALSGWRPTAADALLGPSPMHPIAEALHDELGEDGWWWDDVFDRQVRRALDRLHAVGRVEKRLLPNRRYEVRRRSFGRDEGSQERYERWIARVPQPTVAMWRLAGRGRGRLLLRRA